TLKSSYPIKDIVGHSDVSPGRKTDPGDKFEWSKINEITE
ncbi:MAG: 1,6-anhydro-N-acetylmuramyl-L-alanine amidase AmpD, partial [Candidatus Thioglobus sp.]|nr:1,6-anhydro-N-acetylmuramyl-L-alanine amidase AmpD [Candidatus Thioglobus sp.]